jgi:hypothetical protein
MRTTIDCAAVTHRDGVGYSTTALVAVFGSS